MCFAYTKTPHMLLHSQQGLEREGERSAPAGEGGGNVGMSGWIVWWKGHITLTVEDHVCVNVIAAIITAYMMKRQKVLTQSALILSERVCV